ncbi:MAG TPA: hypothetical protein VFP20_00940 [Bacteroidales bacterium]|nr:hypothetical protein [Bacteroidales bacterium]
MKTMTVTNPLKYLLALLMPMFLFSCGDLWDNHFGNSRTEILNDQVLIVDQSSEEYIQSVDSLSDMYAFLKANGIFDQLKEKGQLHTLFMVYDSNFVAVDTANAHYISNSHVTDISISPSNLYDRERILMWHGKYVSVSLDSLAQLGAIDHIEINDIPVQKVIKTNDGYIYVLKQMINTPKSLFEVVNELGDDYSIFRNLVMEQNVKIFDKANSKPIGVDNTGNTVYDSVFTITNPFFGKKGFDLTSESLTATVMIPSNELIQNAMADAKAKLASWEMVRDTNILKKWILEVAFFNKKYTPADLAANVDITSIYNRQWRNTVQQVDTEHPIALSNGIAYKVTWMKIPNNMLIYRLKDYFYYYENCSDTQKAEYFVTNNLVFKECITDVAAWTPLSGVWPTVENRVLSYGFVDLLADGFTMDFTPIKRISSEGGYVVKPWKIPPGEYRLSMGFKQSLNLNVQIYLNNVDLGPLTLGSATTFHYDRGGVGYAEGYQEALDTPGLITNSKKGNYDRDGGQVAAAVMIAGDANGNPAPIKIRIQNTFIGTAAKMVFHHWCLRPTINNY